MSLVEVEVEVDDWPVRHVYFDQTTSGTLVTGFGIRLFGWCLRNTSSSTAAEVDLYDGPDTSGQIAFPISIGASITDTKWFGPEGILISNALYANVTAGEVRGSILYRHRRH